MKDLRNGYLGDFPPIERDLIRTGIGPLDRALGGGIPRGDVLSLYFVPPVDSSTFVESAMLANLEDGRDIYWAAPWEPDIHRWRRVGIDPGRILVTVPESRKALAETPQHVEHLQCDLFILEGLSTLFREEETGPKETGPKWLRHEGGISRWTGKKTLENWGEQQKLLKRFSRGKSLRNTGAIVPRPLSQQYRFSFPAYASEDDIAVFIRDSRPKRFTLDLLSTRGSMSSQTISCRLGLPL